MNRYHEDTRPVAAAAARITLARTSPWAVTAAFLALALVLWTTAGCRRVPVAGQARPVPVTPRAMASPTPTATPHNSGAVGTRRAALPRVTPAPGLPPALVVTATALWKSLQATQPPPAPRTGGGDPSLAAAPPTVVPAWPYGLSNAPVFNTERYPDTTDNPFVDPLDVPLSTFAVDVDTASYANVRRFIRGGGLPPADAVRIEELVNYFAYTYPAPAPDDPHPLAVYGQVVEAPWQSAHLLVQIALKARELPARQRPPTSLVFLIDVSGSMADDNKLPLVKQSLRLLLDQLGADDRVAIVVYADASGLVLPPTPGGAKVTIADAIERLEAGGSTNGAGGIQLAYDTAAEAFIRGGVNRVILATDGDFNVGITDPGALHELIAGEARRGVYLSVLGYGMGNYQDANLELLADRGDGNYAYIDTLAEARRALVEQLDANLVTVARDVKVQVEINPARVASYRLIGYEDRLLAAQDFADDTRDAGEVGAGHTVTALYEIVPRAETLNPSADVTETAAVAIEGTLAPLRYQRARVLAEAAASAELLTLSVRYKLPDAAADAESTLLVFPVADGGMRLAATNPDVRFAAAVAAWGMLLRDSPYKGSATWDSVLALARDGLGADPGGYRAEFVDLVEATAAMDPHPGTVRGY
jgi:Ca-activated chloride channel homolog